VLGLFVNVAIGSRVIGIMRFDTIRVRGYPFD
jgi:hypothetical protein